MKKILMSLASFIGIFLFVIALWILHNKLRQYHYHDILAAIKSIESWKLYTALILTFVNYTVLTGYDMLAFRYMQRPLKIKDIMFTSFISNAMGNNIGYAMISAGSVRYRLYSTWGISAIESAKVTIFCSATIWLGLFTIGAFIFTIEPMIIPDALNIPFASARPIGILFGVAVLTYLTLTFLRKNPIKIKGWEFKLPPTRLALAQVLVASADWLLVASVLYVLLPKDFPLPFLGFVSVFLLALLTGILSQVPGGLGVFETVLLLLLPKHHNIPSIVGTLLAFRAIYYLLPLGLGLTMLGTVEFLQVRHRLAALTKLFAKWLPALAPRVLAFGVFFGGIILLVSGATPSVPLRLKLLEHFFPLPVMEISHFLASVAGILMLFLARGLQLRLKDAYRLSVVTLTAGVLFLLLKGFDYEETAVFIVLLIGLIPSKEFFYRKTPLVRERLTSGWIAAILLTVISTIWLGFFSFRNIEYSKQIWLQFGLMNGAPRFFRASLGIVGLLLMVAAVRLVRHYRQKSVKAPQSEEETVKAIAANSPDSYANLAFTGDKKFIINEAKNAFIMYGIHGKSWITMGSPVGPRNEWADLILSFRELCDEHSGRPVFYEINQRDLNLYIDLGLTFIKIGEEAKLDLNNFSLEAEKFTEMKKVLKELAGDGYAIEVMPPESISSITGRMKYISDWWQSENKITERCFSSGFFSESYLKKVQCCIVRKGNEIHAFACLWPGAGKNEIATDMVRFGPEAPQYIVDFLLLKIIQWGKEQGYRYFNFGITPLSGFENSELAPLWAKVSPMLFNTSRLNEYNNKFNLAYEPKYITFTEGLTLPEILMDIGELLSGAARK